MSEDILIKQLDIVVPCYNEQECISLFYDEVAKYLESLSGKYTFSVIYVDDGSNDGSLSAIKTLALQKGNDNVKYISFARNFGKESAMYAGLKSSTGDMVVFMDCDLQHPPKTLIEMLKALEGGFDCCAAYRISRKGEPPIRSFFSNLFYRLINKMSDVKIRQGATDFRMMTRQMVDAILLLDEKERFTKGLLSWVGFNTKWIEYENVERAAGVTKWSFLKLLMYAISGIVAFSTAPLRIAAVLGIIITMSTFFYATYMFGSALFFRAEMPGYSSLIISILLLGGIIIMLLGIIGEYLARLYMEVKGRPIFITKETNLKEDSNK